MSALWRTHSHLILLTIQAILLQLVWTQNKYLKNPTVGWIRLILLPISLGVLLSDFVTLRNDLQISPIVKVILASILASRIFKSILLAFNRPSPVRVIKSRESGVQPVQALPGAVLGLVLKSSSNPSKIAGLPPEGSKHTLRSDVTFLISTIRRMVVLNISGVIASYCWKGANDEVLIERYQKIKQYEPQVMAVAWGVLIWTAIDLGGCLGRLSLFTIKAAYRAMSFSTLFQQNLSHVNLSILDLEQTCPFIFTKFPLEASSITDFWSRHWQDRLKDLFVEAGAIPLTSLVIWACGKRKPHPKLLRLCGIIGAFTISAIVHEVGIWSAGPFDRRLRTSIFYLSQALGVCLENGFKSLSGHRVGGPIGRAWTFSWIICFGTPMIQVFMENLAFDKYKLFEHADRVGLWRMLFTSFIVPKLFYSFKSFCKLSH
ncbi:hypothetical protein Pst134EA_000457 [Puccinia striiformis f. sp. tritici]|uniref:hypothetical protein n=1 Tax=Puccinia striiformis f. sp. tritici TaxID=168172 RepID=UPI002007B886|nr:hypothetical protein Pst134EA_000457 [Puccinia striiformis f. sp. tritici]KAH9473383.1 hypothetical protein Pst134EA_000457 [Puccinia striiformis f. sp. tritici]